MHTKKSVCDTSVWNPWADKLCYKTEQKNIPHLTYAKSSSQAAESGSESNFEKANQELSVVRS